MSLASVDWRSFDAFEAYVRGLAEEKDRSDAFETFVSAYLNLTPELSLTDVWPLAESPDWNDSTLAVSWCSVRRLRSCIKP